MKYRAAIIWAVLLVATASCSPVEDSSDPSPRLRGQNEILAAVVSFEAEQPHHVEFMPAKVLFVGVGQIAEMQDPAPAVLAMVKPGNLKVEPFSGCEFQNAGIIERKTGARGILIQFGPVNWENNDNASAEVSIWIANGVGLRYIFHVFKTSGKWIVVDNKSLGSA